jgi:hypothetical protein
MVSLNSHVLEGCLLGDGCLFIGKKCKNAGFSYRSSSKNHVEFVHKHFVDYCSDNYKKIKRAEIYDKRTNKTYVSYYFKTRNNESLTKFYYKWYINGIKIVPSDLVLTNESILFWYLGDGSINQGYIKIHTDSFTIKEVDFLCEKLKKYNAKKLKKEKNNYVVYIPRFNVKDFFNSIGDCPVKDYEHRWEMKNYKNKNVEKNGISDYSDKYDSIVSDYLENKQNISFLSKKYNVPIKCITNYFNFNDIEWKSKVKKSILQYKNSILIKEWESGVEIHNELGYNKSAISECCNKKRKTYKGFIWNFKNI